MRRYLQTVIAIAMLTGTPLPAAGNEDPERVVTMILGAGLQEPGKPGFYSDIAEAILQAAPFETTLVIHPLRRALSEFSTGQSECIWGLDSALLDKLGVEKRPYISSREVLKSTQRVFTLTSGIQTWSLKDLEGKIVGALNGSSSLAELEQVGARVVTLSSQTTKVELLYRNRLEAIVGWTPDIYVTLMGLHHPPDTLVASRYALRVTSVRFVCHESERAAKFIDSLNVRIRNYLETPEFEAIADKYGVPVEKLEVSE